MKSIKEIKKALKSGETTVPELVKSFIEKAKKDDKEIGAFLEIFGKDALETAAKLQDEIDKIDKYPLFGVPIAIKDNILIKGKIASAASKMLENYVASYDATVIERLKSAGAILIGRTNMDEFAMGSSTENSAFKITRNPHDTERVPGGSSGGSAAAVAAGFAPIALGTDTGGSVRQPASFCGVVGFKPSYGAISRYGLIAMGSSLDQAGILSNTVEDVKIVFDILRGSDSKDATAVPREWTDKKEVAPKKKLAVPRNYLKSGVEKEVLDSFEKSLKTLESLGYTIEDVEIPSLEYALSAYYIIMPAEVSTNLARFDGLRYGLFKEGEDYEESFALSRAAGFGKETRRRILLGTFVLSSGYLDAYYYKAVAARELIKKELAAVFENYDAIVLPTSPEVAFKIGEKSSDPLKMYAADIFTVPVNIAKSPAISVPSGYAKVGDKSLPIGVQFIGKEFEDFSLLDLAEEFQNAHEL